MPAIHVSRSIQIHADPAVVHALVRDFKSWPSWSPWLIADPEAKLTFSTDGNRYDWEGPVSGGGFMELVADEAPSTIGYRLTFLKPWKSTSAVGFQFGPDDGGTRVTWTMDGSLPWFMFWMAKMMTSWVGGDYERGLAMLKDRIELGSVPSKVEFPGIAEVGETPYLGIETRCSVAGIGPRMQEDYKKLRDHMENHGLSPAGPPFSIYPRWDPVRGIVHYIACVPLAATPESADGFIAGVRPACRVYQIRHRGPYRHLGNAWAAGMMHARGGLFKSTRGIAPFETYENDPAAVPENELATLVQVPAK